MSKILVRKGWNQAVNNPELDKFRQKKGKLEASLVINGVFLLVHDDNFQIADGSAILKSSDVDACS